VSDAPPTTVGPLAGWRVLVPRPPLDPTPDDGRAPHPTTHEQSGPPLARERSGPTFSPAAVALLAAGAEPWVVPLVRTVPVDDLAPLDDALLALGAGWYTWLTITSQAAVAVLAERAAAHDDGLAALVGRGGVRVGAVGPGTARALEALGVRVDVVPPVRSTAVDLVVALVADDTRAATAAGTAPPPPAGPPSSPSPAGPSPTTSAPRALFPRGDLAAPTLADGLTAAGWAVDDLVVYRTVAAGPPDPQVADAWSAGGVHAALLTSASSVRALLDHLGRPPAATRVVVIGPSTAAEAHRLGLRVDAVATRQTLAGLVDALTDHVVRTGATPCTPPADTPPARPAPSPPPHPTPTEDTP